jgi:hypothetical protein
LSLARAEYDAWLDWFRKSRLPETLEAFISGASPVAYHSADDLQSMR